MASFARSESYRELIRCIRQRHVDRIREICQEHPECFRERSSDHGDLPLHTATLTGVSAEIIELLIQAYPAATSCINRWGCLPLHTASLVSFVQPPRVMQVIIQANPRALYKREYKGLYPLHLACISTSEDVERFRILLQHGPTMARKVYPAVGLPLHMYLLSQRQRQQQQRHRTPQNNNNTLDILQLLTQAYPGAIKKGLPRTALRYCLTALHIACFVNADVETVIHPMVTACPAVVRRRDKVTGDFALHTACKASQAVSPSTMQYLIQIYPEAIKKTNKAGQLALHYAYCLLPETAAVLIQAAKSASESHSSPSSTRYTSSSSSLLLQPCNDGLLPLHAALSVTAASSIRSQESVHAVFDACHDAARVPNKKNQQLPLHLLAMNAQHDREFLTNVLMAYPQAARMSDSAGNLPLHLACTHLHPKHERFATQVEYIYILYKAYPKGMLEPNKAGQFPIHLAISAHALIMWMLEQEPKCWCKIDGYGNSLLHVAVKKQAYHTVQWLLQEYPELSDLKNHSTKQFAIHLALSKWKILELFIEHCADTLLQRDGNGNTILMLMLMHPNNNLNNNKMKLTCIQKMVTACPKCLWVANDKNQLPLHVVIQQDQGESQLDLDVLEYFVGCMSSTHNVYSILDYCDKRGHNALTLCKKVQSNRKQASSRRRLWLKLNAAVALRTRTPPSNEMPEQSAGTLQLTTTTTQGQHYPAVMSELDLIYTMVRTSPMICCPR